MTHSRPMHPMRLLATAGAVLAFGAQAAPGFRVTHDQEALVRPGMSTDEVQAALGRPSENMKFRNEPGPTYTYLITGSDNTVFEVDFDADGKVATTDERDVDIGGGAGGRHGRR